MTRRHNPAARLFDPMRLIHRAIDGGFIDPGYAESADAMRVAEEIADRWASEWPEGEGFGSSDFTYALKDFLDALGVPTHYVGGRLTKKNPRRMNGAKTVADPVERILRKYGFDIQSVDANRVIGQDRLSEGDGYHSRTGYDYPAAALVRQRTADVVAALNALPGVTANARGEEKGWVVVEAKLRGSVAQTPASDWAVRLSMSPPLHPRPLHLVGARIAHLGDGVTAVVEDARLSLKGGWNYTVRLDDGYLSHWHESDTVGGRLTKKNPRGTSGRRNPAKTHSTGLAQRYGALKVGQAVDIRIDSFSALTLRVTGVASTYGEIEVTGTVLATDLSRRHMLAKIPKVGDVVTVPLEAVDSYFIIPRG